MSFEDDLKTPVERDHADVTIALNGSEYVLRFTAVDGLTWADQCDRAPVRAGVTLDGAFGYDLRTLTMNCAPVCGVRVDGDELVPLRVDPVDPQHPEKPRVDEWADLFARIDGNTFRRISDAIWYLNERLPMERMVSAKKARAGSRPSSTLPSKSGSPRKGSTGGNRKKPAPTSTDQTDD